MTAGDGSIPRDGSEDGPDGRDERQDDPKDEHIDDPGDDPEDELIEQLRLLDPVDVESLRSSRSPEALRMLEEILDTADDAEPETDQPRRSS